MSQRNDSTLIEHILREAVAMTKERSRDDLNNNRMLELAMTRLVEIIGEAAAKVTENTRAL